VKLLGGKLPAQDTPNMSERSKGCLKTAKEAPPRRRRCAVSWSKHSGSTWSVRGKGTASDGEEIEEMAHQPWEGISGRAVTKIIELMKVGDFEHS